MPTDALNSFCYHKLTSDIVTVIINLILKPPGNPNLPTTGKVNGWTQRKSCYKTERERGLFRHKPIALIQLFIALIQLFIALLDMT